MILGYQPDDNCEMVPWGRDVFIREEQMGAAFSVGKPVNITFRCYMPNQRPTWGYMRLSGWGMITIPRRCEAQLEDPIKVLRGLSQIGQISVTTGTIDLEWTQRVVRRVQRDRSLSLEARAEVAKNLGIEASKRRQVQQKVEKLETDLERMQRIITGNERVIEELQETMENETVNEAHVERLIQQELPSGVWDTVLAVLYLILLAIVVILGQTIRRAQGTIKQQIDLEEEELGNTLPRPGRTRRNWSWILRPTQCGMDTAETATANNRPEQAQEFRTPGQEPTIREALPEQTQRNGWEQHGILEKIARSGATTGAQTFVKSQRLKDARQSQTENWIDKNQERLVDASTTQRIETGGQRNPEQQMAGRQEVVPEAKEGKEWPRQRPCVLQTQL